MSVIGDACDGLAAYLTEALPDFKWQVGMLDGPIKQPPSRGCVFGLGGVPDGLHQRVTLHVRAFISRRDRPRDKQEKSQDPHELYELDDQMLLVLGDKQAAQFGLWNYNLVSHEVDHTMWGVEVILDAPAGSPFEDSWGE